MPLQVTVIVRGNKETQAKLLKLGKDLIDFSGANAEIGEELKSFYSGQVFTSQGRALGVRWKALTAAYARRKAKKHSGSGLLVASGDMQKAFKYEADKSGVLIYNDDPKFEWHQLGTGFKGSSKSQVAVARHILGLGGGSSMSRGGNLPARKMMGVNTNVKTIISKIVDRDIERKLQRAGL